MDMSGLALSTRIAGLPMGFLLFFERWNPLAFFDGNKPGGFTGI